MPTQKRKYPNGTVTWRYYFDLPGSTRANRLFVSEGGFATEREAKAAEAARRVGEAQKAEAAARGVTAPLPKTLGALLEEFCAYSEEQFAAKTAERDRQMVGSVDLELRALSIKAITPLHFTREWSRLRKEGGHHRRTGEARPLSRKTVSNIRGMVSSAFTWAASQGLAELNPVKASVAPKGGDRRKAVALAPAQQQFLIDASTHPLLPYILEVSAGLGTRRGETLALRWADVQHGQAVIWRVLTQSKKKGLEFRERPKTDAGYRILAIPQSIQSVLDEVRKMQDAYRALFGPDYRRDLDLVFSKPDGEPLRPDSISSLASALCKRAKMPKGVNLHALRHTHGSQLLAAGMELPAVSRRLGHSSPAVTAKFYSHILDGRDQAAADLWDSINAKKAAAPAAPRQHQTGDGAQKRDDGNPGDTQNERVRPN